MKIYDKKGNLILDIAVEDKSYRYRAIRQGDKVHLYFSLIEHIEIPIYSYIEYSGQRYTLWKPENLTKHGERNIEYSVEFGGWWEMLNRTRYKLLASKPHKVKFPLTATPKMFLQLMVDNLNLHDSGWTVGTCIIATEKAMSFNNESCMAVLNRLADEFNTEFEFINKTVNLGKVERFKDSPLPLSYGKGNGFKTGIGRQNQGDKAPVTILYVQGGERNIDVSAYKSPTLLLPKNQELQYQGRRYKTDADGMYIVRADKELTEFNEDSYDGSKFYPSRVGTISEVITVDAEKHFYDIKDASIPEALDYRNYRIAGEKAVIIFQSGILEGKEFEIEQTENALTGYIHAERRFKIVPEKKDGKIMPDKDNCPAIGDKYAIFNISLPEAYVCNNATKEGASWDMFREAVQYMYENEEQNFTFKGELDGIWSKKNWYEIGGKITPGGYVLFSDTQFQKEGILIRIIGVKDYINKPHAPELELSNTPVAGFISSDLGKLEAEEVNNQERHKEALTFTKRRFRDADRALTMLETAVQGYSEGINPIWIKSMAALFGHESLQFRFVNSKTSPSTVGSGVTYNNTAKVLTIPKGIIQHMSIGINTLSPIHKPEEYKFWDMAYTSASLNDPDAMYVYAKCSKTTSTGTFLLSKTAKDFDNSDGNYYLLIGILSDEYEDYRSYVECYGFTEILPGRITLWKIVDPDGFQYWDMQNQAFRIGNENNYLAYNVDGLRRVVLKGIMVQSPSGSESPLPVHVGAYSSSRQYYAGDEVTYNGSTYRAIRDTKGIVPTNTTYWTVIAQKGNPGNPGNPGSDGRDGPGSRSIYFPARSTSEAPSAPLGTGSNTPSGWWTYPSYPSESYKYIYVTTSQYDGASWSSWSTPTLYAQKGIPGALPTTRKWKSGETYVRNDRIVDYIIFKDTDETTSWWRVREGYTSVVAGSRPNTSYFEQISSYEAIATTVLLAEQANLAEFIFKQGQLVSQDTTNGVPNLIMNGRTGFIQALNGRFLGTLGTPFRILNATSTDILVNLDEGANVIAPTEYGKIYTVRLPIDLKYNGVRCFIMMGARTKSSGYSIVKTQSNLPIYVSGSINPVYSIELTKSYSIAEFLCVKMSNDQTVEWMCLNYNNLME